MFEMNPKEWLYIIKVRHVWYKRDGQGILERDEGQKIKSPGNGTLINMKGIQSRRKETH